MGKWIARLITLLIILVLIGIIVFVYNRFYFNDFIKATTSEHSELTKFYRDADVKNDKVASYCIENTDFTDGLFFKEIKVEKYTPYRITCMVKTENVESDNPDTAGACISIMNTAEQSIALQGTNETWQKLTLMVNSEDSDSLRVAFRLGGYSGNSKGKAWFSNLKVEKGEKSPTNEWNIVCFLINNVNVTLDGKQFTYTLTNEDKRLLEDNLRRFSDTVKTFSNGKMTAKVSTVEITQPLTSLSYDEENYYYAAPSDLKPLIDNYVKENEYDHIFIGIRMGTTLSEIPVKDWIGLGSMRYGQIGFSDIRMPNDLKNSTMYKYDIRNDTFPEEVFVHEFLHSLERNLVERGYTIPALHDNEKFGYKNQDKSGLKAWYKDYMQCNIASNIGLTGLDPYVYSTMPVHSSEFANATEIAFEENPKGPIDAVIKLFANFKNMLSNQAEEAANVSTITLTSD